MDKMWHFLIFLTVLKRFCPLDSKNVFVLVPPHLEPEVKLFGVWEIMVLQIIVTIIANVINFKASKKIHFDHFLRPGESEQYDDQ